MTMNASGSAVAVAVLMAMLVCLIAPADGRAQTLQPPAGGRAQTIPPPAPTGGAVAVLATNASPWTIGDELWDRPRSADVIRLLPAVRAAVAAIAGTPRASLVIRHAGGQNEELRAEELRHWLVALAVEPGRIEIAPAPAAAIERLPHGSMVLELAR